MRIIDGHSHMYQKHATVDKLKKNVSDIEGFGINLLLTEEEIDGFLSGNVLGLWNLEL